VTGIEQALDQTQFFRSFPTWSSGQARSLPPPSRAGLGYP
jgi:hypothetical protein